MLVQDGRGFLHEVFEPCGGDAGAEIGCVFLVIRDRFAPVEADPAPGERPGAIDKLVQFLGGTSQGKHFLNDDWFADVINGECVECFIDLALFWIEMEADKIEVLADFRRVKEWLGICVGQRPGDGSNGDEVA